jgi:hypothetical protein
MDWNCIVGTKVDSSPTKGCLDGDRGVMEKKTFLYGDGKRSDTDTSSPRKCARLTHPRTPVACHVTNADAAPTIRRQSLRLLEPPVHTPAKALPQHLVPPPEPLHLDLPRQRDDADPERELDVAARGERVHDAIAPLALEVAPVCALPHVLARLADARGGIVRQVQTREVRVDRVLCGCGGHGGGECDGVGCWEGEGVVCDCFEAGDAL